jgi:hypothetical protein
MVLSQMREEEQFIKFCIVICQQKKRPDERKFRRERFASVHSPVDVVDKNVLCLEK